MGKWMIVIWTVPVTSNNSDSEQIFISFCLYVLTSMEDIRRGSVYKCKGVGGLAE